MKVIDLALNSAELFDILLLAESEPILILSAGKEYMLSAVDDFEAEVDALRNSAPFQAFLDERRKPGRRISIDEIERRLAVKTK